MKIIWNFVRLAIFLEQTIIIVTFTLSKNPFWLYFVKCIFLKSVKVNALPSAYRTGGDGAASTASSSMIQHEFLENALKDVTQRSSALLQEVPVQSTSADSDPSLLSIVQSQESLTQKLQP